uniref:Cytochrome b n=1 Tax=Hygrobates longiporus TaxID=2740590 RepID=A0A6J4EFE5_9ACAR|nr:cytochrome B [Hygrobates longiporus]BCG28128.1 cytochrome B [Hygrobates longiporus]
MKKKVSHFSSISKSLQFNILMLPSPANISYMWNFGSLLGMNLGIQLISGIMVSMHYNSDSFLAFDSVMHISRDVNFGWIMKLIHMNGASLFFIFIYMHISRGMLFSSFKKKETWSSGIIILFLLMATAFLGYVLPWGQMSFWGATVITNLVSAIPWVGEMVVNWLWGGFSVSNATLNRFFSLHFLLPFILTFFVGIHIILLHEPGSTNPLGLKPNYDKMTFHPYFSLKDFLAPSMIFTFVFILMMLNPFILGDPENFNPANPMTTPIHIQPEWYFLFAYAILRSIPNKLGGVLALVSSIFILFLLPFKKKLLNSSKFSPLKKSIFWFTALTFLILTWGGAKPIEPPFEGMMQLFSIMYFMSMFMN